MAEAGLAAPPVPRLQQQYPCHSYKRGSPEYTNLELYLAWRGMGLKVETPSVRQ